MVGWCHWKFTLILQKRPSLFNFFGSLSIAFNDFSKDYWSNYVMVLMDRLGLSCITNKLQKLEDALVKQMSPWLIGLTGSIGPTSCKWSKCENCVKWAIFIKFVNCVKCVKMCKNVKTFVKCIGCVKCVQMCKTWKMCKTL